MGSCLILLPLWQWQIGSLCVLKSKVQNGPPIQWLSPRLAYWMVCVALQKPIFSDQGTSYKSLGFLIDEHLFF